MKLFLRYVFIVILSLLLILALYRVLGLIFTKKDNSFSKATDNQYLSKVNRKYIYYDIYWKKNLLFIPINRWNIQQNQTDLISNQKYYLYFYIEPNIKCFFGDFFLKDMSENALVFERFRPILSQQFFEFASLQLGQLQVIITPSLNERFVNCNHWRSHSKKIKKNTHIKDKNQFNLPRILPGWK